MAVHIWQMDGVPQISICTRFCKFFWTTLYCTSIFWQFLDWIVVSSSCLIIHPPYHHVLTQITVLGARTWTKTSVLLWNKQNENHWNPSFRLQNVVFRGVHFNFQWNFTFIKLWNSRSQSKKSIKLILK